MGRGSWNAGYQECINTSMLKIKDLKTQIYHLNIEFARNPTDEIKAQMQELEKEIEAYERSIKSDKMEMYD